MCSTLKIYRVFLYLLPNSAVFSVQKGLIRCTLFWVNRYKWWCGGMLTHIQHESVTFVKIKYV